MSKLNVLFLAGWYPTDEKATNAIFIKEHAIAVSSYCEIVVLTTNNTTKRKLFEIVSDRIEDGVRTIRFNYHRPYTKTQWLFYALGFFCVFRWLKKNGFTPDVIHGHIYYTSFIAIILSKLYNTPVILTEQTSKFPKKMLTWSELKRTKFAMERANYVLPVSNFLKNSIKSYGIDANYRVVPNVVNINIFFPKHKVVKNCKEKKILTVALFGPDKGFEYLFESFGELIKNRHDFVLDIIGDGPMADEYLKLTKQHKVNHIINFHGEKSKEEVAKYMRECDFFVLPSVIETFGTVYIEAMACGKPVIGPRDLGPSDFINDQVGLLVSPRNISELTKAIEYMLDNYDKYSPDNIFEYIKSSYSSESIGKFLLSIYEGVIEVEK